MSRNNKSSVETDKRVIITLGNGKKIHILNQNGVLTMGSWVIGTACDFLNVLQGWEIAGLINEATFNKAFEEAKNILQ